MLNKCKYFQRLRYIPISTYSNKLIQKHNKFNLTDFKYFSTNKYEVNDVIREKYISYKDKDSVTIFDLQEQKQHDIFEQKNSIKTEIYEEDINLKRGMTGVFDIEDLLDILKKETAEDIFYCKVAKELNYVDYMCVVTGRSYRHMLAIAQLIRKTYKKKCGPNDILPKIEGEECENWMAMDLGNIALHIFNFEARQKYDLETLWSSVPDHDKTSDTSEDTSETRLKIV